MLLPRAEAFRAVAFPDESGRPFLPFARDAEGVLGLWLVDPRPDGDFAVLRVTGTKVEVLANSTAEWISYAAGCDQDVPRSP